MAVDPMYPPVIQRRQDGNIYVPTGKKIEIETGGDISVNGVSLIDEVAALNGLDTTELGYVNGVVAGTATASKAVVLGASKEIATITSATITTLTSTTVNTAALTGTTTATMTSANAAALAVGLAGATNPAFVVDSSTASQAAGLKVTGAVAAGTVAAAVISSGADASLTINAKGAGAIGIGSVSTGAVTITPATTITGVVTPTGGIAPAGGFTASPRQIWTGGLAENDNATPATTETYCSEVFVPCNMTITGVALFNGTDVTGNVTVGLADSTGAPIAAAKSASTAGSGVETFQRIPFAAPYAAKGPATYYIQVQYSSATARYTAHALGNHSTQKQTGQVYGTLTSFTPAGTFTASIGNIAGLY